MKITDLTTLIELEAERKRLGITHLLVTLKPSPLMLGADHVEVSIITEDGMLAGSNSSIPDALNDAFYAREQQIAELIRRGS